MAESCNFRWSKFWWEDYDSDLSLAQCSLAAQGLWMRMLCVMQKAQPYGHLVIAGQAIGPADLARTVRASLDEISPLLAELERWNVFSRDEAGTIFCRRMVRDLAAYVVGRENGKKGGNPNLKRPSEQKDNPKQEQEVSDGVNPPSNPLEAEKHKNLEAKKDIPPSADETRELDLGEPNLPPWDLICRDLLPFVAERTQTDISVRKGRDRVMSFLTKMRREAGDDALLLEILRDAQRDPPRDIASWVKGVINRRKAKGPVLAVDNDPDDPWGVRAWCRTLPGVRQNTDPDDLKSGQFTYQGWIVDYVAREVAISCRFPVSARIDWRLLGEWLDAGCAGDHIIAKAREMAGRVDSVGTLAFFDQAMRQMAGTREVA